MRPDFRDNVMVVTGASRGIGRELALQAARHGACLVLGARSAGDLQAVVRQCQSLGARAIAVRTDVSKEASCRRLVQSAVEEFERIDTLINNAGVTMWARFEELEDASVFEWLLKVNFMGSVYCTHHALPHLLASEGRIVGVASLTAKFGVPTRSGYAASKHAMAGFFDSLRIELAETGVTVTVVYPDFVRSEVRARALGPDGKPLGRSPVDESQVMPADACARKILEAAWVRRRELVMSARGKLGLWLKVLAPSLLDAMARRAIDRGR